MDQKAIVLYLPRKRMGRDVIHENDMPTLVKGAVTEATVIK
jgi:hypothetical protein